MMMLSKALLSLSCFLLISSVCAEIRVVREHTTALPVPHGWAQTGLPAASHMTRLTIAVKQQNTDLLDQLFWEVSDPKSPIYGQHITMEEANALVAPSSASKQKIVSWLSSFNLKNFKFSAGGDFIIVYASVAEMELLLETTYHVYTHQSSGQELVRALSPYTVPSSVSPHIDFIGGLTHFPKNTKAYKPNNKVESPMASVTPSVIKKFFQIDPSTVGNATNNSQAVAQFLQQYYTPITFDLPVQAVSQVVGPNDANNPGDEASLDIEYIMGTAPGVPTWFVYTDGLHDGQEPFLDWIVNMSSSNSSPWVHSVSYGDVESTISFDYTQRVNTEFQKYGATGRSILFASGDDGTGCTTNCKQFQPNWPATSPFVTAVGGIYLDGNTPVGDSISSGGFSDYFSQPSYQSTAVQNYLTTHGKSPSPSAYNASGRAVPDIASFSENVVIVMYGSSTFVGGTSCAAPVISGVISLLNDARLQEGKSTLGFLNPFIYQTLADHPDAFIDVTKGSNPSGCCDSGFSAASGWDPITGVGVPNFPNLKQYALAV